MKKRNFFYWVLPVLSMAACSTLYHHSDTGGERTPSSVRSNTITADERARWEHMTIGSNVIPYVWYKAMTSVKFSTKKPEKDLPLMADAKEMERRYGIKESAYRVVTVNGAKRTYASPYVGVAVSWSNTNPTEADAFLDEKDLVHDMNGVKSVRMVGINCAFCHQTEQTASGQKINVLGAPSQTDVNGYYEDQIASTVAMFVKKDKLKKFLEKVKEQNPELLSLDAQQTANDIHLQFKRDVGFAVTGNHNAFINNFAYYWTLISAQYLKNRKQFRKISPAIKTAYISLLRVTHNLSQTDDIGNVVDTADWVSRRGVGEELHVTKTPYYFGRSDAFGSFGNAVVRGKEAVNLDAPVSFPWVWGTKYMAFAHYEANLNSPVQRNIGAGLAIGGTFSVEEGRTSVNLHAVDYLESVMHRISPPVWGDVFKSLGKQAEYKVKEDKLSLGKKIYEGQCMTCHETNKKVGPEKNLRDYVVTDLKELGTDPNAATNLVKKVGGQPFSVKATAVAKMITDLYFKSNNVPLEEQERIYKTNLHGAPLMRDTNLGFSKQDQLGLDYGNIAAGAGYKARHLSGAWITGPFLHNNSVPTLAELLSPSNERPKAFSYTGKMSFDPVRVGPMVVRTGSCPKVPKDVPQYERCLDTTLKGNSNAGHEYGTKLSADHKMALIEYLKVLPPEPEYNLGKN